MNLKKAKATITENKWIILILFIGIVLRIIFLGKESFWLDESETIFATQKNSSYIISSMYKNILAPEIFGPRGGGSMPFYYLLAKYWVAVFGLTEFKLRFLSAIFGIVSIYLVYLIGKEFFGKKVGLIASFIISINHQHIYYSQEARMYSLMIMLTLLSVYSFYKLLFQGKIKYSILYIISTIALLYTHYYSILVITFQIFYYFVSFKYLKSKLKMILSWSVVFLAYLPWLPALFRQFSRGSLLSGIQGPLSLNKLIALTLGFNSWITPDLHTRMSIATFKISGITPIGWLTIICILLLSILMLLLFFRNIVSLYFEFLKSGLKDKKSLLLILWIFVPLIVLFAFAFLSPATSTLGEIRYVLFISPAYYFFISKSIANLKEKKELIVLIAIIIFSLAPIYSYYQFSDKGEYREAASYILSNSKGSEPIIVHGAPVLFSFKYYFDKFEEKNQIYSSFDMQKMEIFADSQNDIWVVASMLKYYDPKNLFLTHMNSKFAVVDRKDFTDVTVIRYKKSNG